MYLTEQTQHQQILNDILNNTTAALPFHNQHYYLLIKKQKNKEYCTLYLTDCYENFWLEKVDIQYCEKLKEEIKIKSDLVSFVRQLVEGIKANVKIQQVKPQPILKVCMKISEGLIINCSLKLNVEIGVHDENQYFKKLMKCFMKELFEAKDAEIFTLKEEMEKGQGQKEKKQKKQSDTTFIKNVLNIQEKKQLPPKNRDLINPHKKKRKNQGIKIGSAE